MLVARVILTGVIILEKLACLDNSQYVLLHLI